MHMTDLRGVCGERKPASVFLLPCEHPSAAGWTPPTHKSNVPAVFLAHEKCACRCDGPLLAFLGRWLAGFCAASSRPIMASSGIVLQLYVPSGDPARRSQRPELFQVSATPYLRPCVCEVATDASNSVAPAHCCWQNKSHRACQSANGDFFCRKARVAARLDTSSNKTVPSQPISCWRCTIWADLARTVHLTTPTSSLSTRHQTSAHSAHHTTHTHTFREM